MILDAGICMIFRVNGSGRGIDSPTAGMPVVYRNWFGLLHCESKAGGISSCKIRVHDADIQEFDIAAFGGKNWIVTRAYHGYDDDNGQPIADLTLDTGESLFRQITLIDVFESSVNEHGFVQPAAESTRVIWCMERERTHNEYAESNAEGMHATVRVDLYANEYRGELLAEYGGKRYTVEKTHTQGGNVIELTLDNAAEGGTASGKV